MARRARSLDLVLVADEAVGVRMLRALGASPHRIMAVLTPEPKGPTVGSVWHLARELELPILPPRAVKDSELLDRVGAFDLLLNVHSLYIIGEQLLRAPRIGAFNLHPGPLPRYAGLNVPSWARYRGEPEHGVTVHWMEPGIDTGDIAYQHNFPITERDTGLSISTACARHGLVLLDRLLEAASRGAEIIPRMPQDLSLRQYFGREVPDAGELRWSQSAMRIIDKVRAFDYHPYRSPWGRLWCDLGGREVGLIKARRTHRNAAADPGTLVVTGDGGGFLVAAADEWIEPTLLDIDGEITRPAPLLASGRLAVSSVA